MNLVGLQSGGAVARLERAHVSTPRRAKIREGSRANAIVEDQTAKSAAVPWEDAGTAAAPRVGAISWRGGGGRRPGGWRPPPPPPGTPLPPIPPPISDILRSCSSHVPRLFRVRQQRRVVP